MVISEKAALQKLFAMQNKYRGQKTKGTIRSKHKPKLTETQKEVIREFPNYTPKNQKTILAAYGWKKLPIIY